MDPVCFFTPACDFPLAFRTFVFPDFAPVLRTEAFFEACCFETFAELCFFWDEYFTDPWWRLWDLEDASLVFFDDLREDTFEREWAFAIPDLL